MIFKKQSRFTLQRFSIINALFLCIILLQCFQLLIHDKCDTFNASRKKNHDSKQKFEAVRKFNKNFNI